MLEETTRKHAPDRQSQPFRTATYGMLMVSLPRSPEVKRTAQQTPISNAVIPTHRLPPTKSLRSKMLRSKACSLIDQTPQRDARMPKGAVGLDPVGTVSLRVARRSGVRRLDLDRDDGLLDFVAAGVDDDAATAGGLGHAVARGAEVEDLDSAPVSEYSRLARECRRVAGRCLPRCTSDYYAARRRRSGARRSAPARPH